MDRVTPNTFVAMFNRDSVMMGETPSGNGVCSARGLAAVGTAMTCGGRVAGGEGRRRLLREETVEEMHRGLERARDAGMGGTVTEFSQVRNKSKKNAQPGSSVGSVHTSKN